MEELFEKTVKEVIEILIREGEPLRDKRVKDAVDTIILVHNLTIKKD